MSVRFLLDENLPPEYQTQLAMRRPDLVVHRVGDKDAPPHGAADPEILRWCEQHDLILVTNDRRSMPGHLARHLAAGGHVPGVLTLRPRAAFGAVLQNLLDIADAAYEGEFHDRIAFVPL